MKILFSLILILSLSPASAQQYLVRLKTMKVRLYAGYVNPIVVDILHPGDSSTYIFHAQAKGATIDYDMNGRVQVLPYQKEGEIRMFAEKNGSFYTVHGVLKFESVRAPADDATFIATMGISKEDDKKRIKHPKKFLLPPGAAALESGLRMEGMALYELRTDELNIITVSVLKRLGELMVSQEGTIELTSREARIKKIDAATFYITPLQGQKRCRLAVHLNGEKAGEEVVSVWTPPSVD